MPKYVALLRGVNVGKGKRVPMAELRTLLAQLGYTGVVTLLNSGNAVFDAPRGAPAKLATTIAAAILDRLGVEVPVIVKSADEIDAIVSANKLKVKDEHHSRFLVAFVQDDKAAKSLAVLEPLVVPPEKLVIGKHAAYLYCANGILESKAGAALVGKAGKSATSRNWATVLKLHALASGQAG